MNAWQTWQVKKQTDGAMIGHRLTWHLVPSSCILLLCDLLIVQISSRENLPIPQLGLQDFFHQPPDPYAIEWYEIGVLSSVIWVLFFSDVQDVEVGDLRFNAETVWLGGFQPPSFNIEPEKNKLGGGFKYFLFSPLLGEDSHFDEHIFQMVETTN